MTFGYSKEQQLEHYIKRREAKKPKGIAGEEKAISQICDQLGRKPGKKDRRNHQGKEGGGLGNPDISIAGLTDWHLEIKNTERFSFTEFIKQMSEDCPRNKRPALIYKGWMMFRVTDLSNLAADVVEAAGGEIIWP